MINFKITNKTWTESIWGENGIEYQWVGLTGYWAYISLHYIRVYKNKIV